MLKKPLVAFILCVIVVISATIINVHVRLDDSCAVISEGFTEPGGIADQLSAVCTASSGFAKLAEKYGMDEFSTFNVNDIATSLRINVGYTKASGLADLYRMLIAGTDDLRTSLRLKELSEEDAKLYAEFEAEYLAAQKAIADSSYNSTVSNYLRGLGSFSCFMATICGVDLPEQFA